MGSKFGAFLLGAAAGAAVVFFVSPRSGFENRNLAKDAVSAVLDGKCGDSCNDVAQAAKSVLDKGQVLAKSALDKGQEFYVTASGKVQEMVAGATAGAGAVEVPVVDKDELRQKIDAARMRIAAQVLKNAEEAEIMDAEVVPVEGAAVVETVEEAAEEAVEEVAVEAEEPVAQADEAAAPLDEEKK